MVGLRDIVQTLHLQIIGVAPKTSRTVKKAVGAIKPVGRILVQISYYTCLYQLPYTIRRSFRGFDVSQSVEHIP